MATKIQIEKAARMLTVGKVPFSTLRTVAKIFDPAAKVNNGVAAKTVISKALGTDPVAKISGLPKADQDRLLDSLGIKTAPAAKTAKPVQPSAGTPAPAAQLKGVPGWILAVAGVILLAAVVFGVWRAVNASSILQSQDAVSAVQAQATRNADQLAKVQKQNENARATDQAKMLAAIEALKATPEPVAATTDPVATESSIEAPADSTSSASVSSGQEDQAIVYDAKVNFAGNFPEYFALYKAIWNPGDVSNFLITFAGVEGEDLTVNRAVADDSFTKFVYYATPDSEGIDLIPLFKMGPVNTASGKSEDKDLASYMKSRGVNLEIEILDQNYQAVHLGKISQGAYVLVQMKDNPKLQVNSGGLVSVTRDTDLYTVELDGINVSDPTFVLK